MASPPPAGGGPDERTEDDPPIPLPLRPLPPSLLVPASSIHRTLWLDPFQQNPSSSDAPPSSSRLTASTSEFVLPSLTAVVRTASCEIWHSIYLHGDVAAPKSRKEWRALMRIQLQPFLSVLKDPNGGLCQLSARRSISDEVIYSASSTAKGYARLLRGHLISVDILAELQSQSSWRSAIWHLLLPFLPVLMSEPAGLQRPRTSCSELIYSIKALGRGHARLLAEDLIFVDARYCFIWSKTTGETMVLFSVQLMLSTFPRANSSIVLANLHALIGRLSYPGNGLWLAPRYLVDWAELPGDLVQYIVARTCCVRTMEVAFDTCHSWRHAIPLLPWPVLLDPNHPSGPLMMCKLLAPTRGFSSDQHENYHAVSVPVLHTDYNLIGGSGSHLIFFEGSVCYIQNINTGVTAHYLVPECCGRVYYGVLSASPTSAGSYIILVSESLISRTILGSDNWDVDSLESANVGRVSDIVFVGGTAYMMDNRGSLFSVSASLEVTAVNDVSSVSNAFVPGPTRVRAKFGSKEHRAKIIFKRHWLLERQGDLICVSYRQRADGYAGFFAFCIRDNSMYEFFGRRAAALGRPNFVQNRFEWQLMNNLGNSSVFLNWASSCSFVVDVPRRWGLKNGRIYFGDPDVRPWRSFCLGWVKYSLDDIIIPLHAKWPCPLFMNSELLPPNDEVEGEVAD